MVCIEAVTKQFVQSSPGERQLCGAPLVRSRTASTEGCLSPSLPSASCELISTAGPQRSHPATQGRARARECVCVGLKGRHRALQCVSVAFSDGHLNWDGGGSLGKAAGGVAASALAEVGCEQYSSCC